MSFSSVTRNACRRNGAVRFVLESTVARVDAVQSGRLSAAPAAIYAAAPPLPFGPYVACLGAVLEIQESTPLDGSLTLLDAGS